MKKQFVCKLCGHQWKSRKDDIPLACPRCKRYDWDKEKKE